MCIRHSSSPYQRILIQPKYPHKTRSSQLENRLGLWGIILRWLFRIANIIKSMLDIFGGYVFAWMT